MTSNWFRISEKARALMLVAEGRDENHAYGLGSIRSAEAVATLRCGHKELLAAALEYAAEVLVEESLDKFEPPEDFSTQHADRLGAMKVAVEGDIRILRNYAEKVRKIG